MHCCAGISMRACRGTPSAVGCVLATHTGPRVLPPWVAAALTREDNSSSSTRSFASRGGRGGRGSSSQRGGSSGGYERSRGSSSYEHSGSSSSGHERSGSDYPRESRGPPRQEGSSRGPGRGGQWGPPDKRQQQQPYRQQQQQRYRERDDYEAGGDDWQGDDDGYGSDNGFLYPARASKASIMDTLSGDALYGVAPVLAALTAGIRRPYALLMQEGLTAAARKDGRALAEIQRLAAAAGAELRTMSKHDLNMLSGNRPHQGLILDASPLIWREKDVLPSIDTFRQGSDSSSSSDSSDAQQQEQQQEQQEQQEGDSSSSSSSGQSRLRHPVWLALDEVTDPQNLGAMLRSAYCMGVSGVLACSRNCAPLSPVVSKASAGAMELMSLHSCKSMPRTLAAAVNSGWAVVGAAAESDAMPLSDFKLDGPTLLVMGNEGYGLRPLVKRLCTQLVQIEMAPLAVDAGDAAGGSGRAQTQLVDSLNVSVATGILLHHMLASAK